MDTDRQIAEKVMGWNAQGFKLQCGADAKKVLVNDADRVFWYADNKRLYNIETWRPSTNIAHAFEVVEKMDDCLYLRQHGPKGNWSASFCGYQHGHLNESHADTPAMAICLAALKAVTP